MVQKNSLKKIVIVCGPTASGKSDLAIEVAKILDSEVISADSMYIYKGLNVGTAKPTFAEMQGIKHHLIDVVEPNQTFTVSDYKTLAEPLRFCDDPDVIDPIRFLRAREVVHYQRFGENLRLLTDKLDSKNFYAFNPGFDKRCFDKKQ